MAQTLNAAINMQTQPLEEQTVSFSQTPSLQAQSALLARLPYELRQRIWLYVYGGSRLYIAHSQSDLKPIALDCARIPKDNNVGDLRRRNPLGLDDRPSFFTTEACFEHFAKQDHFNAYHARHRVVLARPLSTCQILYTEGMPLLLKANTFVFDNAACIPLFRSTLTDKHFAHLSSIQLCHNVSNVEHYIYESLATGQRNLISHNWSAGCRALAALPKLRVLEVLVAGDGFTSLVRTPAALDAFLRPLFDVRASKSFRVLLWHPPNVPYQAKPDQPFEVEFVNSRRPWLLDAL